MKTASALFIAALAALAFEIRAEPANSPRESKVLLIPVSVLEQKLTDAMQVELRRLKENDSLSKLTAWNRLAELPSWVFEKDEKPEIAYLGTLPAAATDAFRYAVITAKAHETIVVRAGGLAGVYEIYQKKKEPN